MRKTIILSLFCLSSTLISAQYVNYQSSEKANTPHLKVGHIRAQLGVGQYSSGDEGEIIPTMTSWSLSLTCNSPIYHNMGIEWGIVPKYIFGKKSGEESSGNYSNQWKYAQSHYQLEVPILYNYRYYFTPNLYLKGLAGVFFQYGLSGKYSMEENINGEKDFSDGDYFEGMYKRFDFGLKLGIEVGWNNFSLAWYYNKGVISLSEADEKGRNSVLRSFESGVKLGYSF